MAVSTGPLGSGNIDVTRAATFIPEMWSDEVLAAYTRKNVMMGLVRKYPFMGKKGDTLHIPVPSRGQATAKVAKTQVNLQFNTASELTMVVDKHYEYSKLFEDIMLTQAMNSYRRFFTEDAGYQLSQQIDTDLIQLGRYANNGNGAVAYAAAYIGSDGTTLYTGSNEAAITDAAIRRTIQRLDDNDVPTTDRFMLIPPSAKNTLLGLARFTEQSFTGETGSGNSIRNGRVGDIYGMDVYVSSACDTATGDARIVLIGHKDAFAIAMQKGIRVQTQNKLEYLGDLLVADVLYGVKAVRVGASSDLASAVYALAVTA